MPINVSEALCADTAEKVIVKRYTGAFVDGIWEESIPSTFKALASSQQPTASQIQRLPEGIRDNDSRLFICNKKLRATSDRDSVTGDVVTWEGVDFEITALGDWFNYGFTMAYGVRVK